MPSVQQALAAIGSRDCAGSPEWNFAAEDHPRARIVRRGRRYPNRGAEAIAGVAEGGQLRGRIFGENWSKTDEATWWLLQAQAELKSDPHLGRRNQGITVVVL
jgi:hypothetical protein